MTIDPTFDPNTIALPNGHLLNGSLVSGAQQTITVRRPSDGAVYAELPAGDAATVDDAVKSALTALDASGWAAAAPRDRAKVMRKWAALIESRATEVARIEALGSSRPISEALHLDVPYAADCIRFFAEYADKLGGEIAATRSDNLGFILAEPYGVVGAIVPWNVPISTAAWKVGPALAAGNAMVMKPSELTPFSAVILAQLGVEAGIPAGIFSIVQGAGSVVGDAICRHPGISKVSFTGSTSTGVTVMRACAESGPKPITLELGGKSPQLVYDDVSDLSQTADAVARSILNNAGQGCVAGSRLIAHKRIADPLVELIVARMKQIRADYTWKSLATFSPIISRDQATRIDALVRSTVQAGASIIHGGGLLDVGGEGAFYSPTLLDNVTSDMAAVREEVFGPVLTVQRFEDEAEGLSLADHPSYGLAAGIHTGDINKALRAMRALKAGTVWINRYGRTADHILPTGGYKQSGIGKDLGRQAVEGNMRHKSILIDFSATAVLRDPRISLR